ncbi:hypothetical protein BpsS140_00006 [Bacillus phage vB_BpsS-140]|nr:hypothetical protein BpsS140_00006 [Bacillus phage vB_BpsS-140]
MRKSELELAKSIIEGHLGTLDYLANEVPRLVEEEGEDYYDLVERIPEAVEGSDYKEEMEQVESLIKSLNKAIKDSN